MTVSFFATTDMRLHRHLRSRVTGAYSMSDILSMEPLIQEIMDLSWKKPGELADTDQIVFMDKWVNYFAFDAVARIGMGGPLGFLEQGQDVNGIIRSIHDGFYVMADMGNMPLQMWWFNNPLSSGSCATSAANNSMRWTTSSNG
jgi:hypothetical protein